MVQRNTKDTFLQEKRMEKASTVSTIKISSSKEISSPITQKVPANSFITRHPHSTIKRPITSKENSCRTQSTVLANSYSYKKVKSLAFSKESLRIILKKSLTPITERDFEPKHTINQQINKYSNTLFSILNPIITTIPHCFLLKFFQIESDSILGN